jgi:hypothetical protein
MEHSLLNLVRATEELRQEAEAGRAEQERWRQVLRDLTAQVGGRNQVAKLLGLSAPYVGRVLRGDKPLTQSLIGHLQEFMP